VKSQHFAALVGALLLVAALLLVTGKPEGEPAPAATEPDRVVTVTGEGEVRVKPDEAHVSFGVLMHGPSAAEAEALALETARRVQEAIAQAGGDVDRLEISHLTLSATTYQDFAGTARISGFQAQASVQAVIRNLSKVQAVLDAGLAAGATSLDGVAYTLENPESAKQAAMKAALENARQRATTLVRAEGERLGELRNVEVLLEENTQSAASPASLVFRARVRATFGY
jgi:uncharacterized protein YggE